MNENTKSPIILIDLDEKGININRIQKNLKDSYHQYENDNYLLQQTKAEILMNTLVLIQLVLVFVHQL